MCPHTKEEGPSAPSDTNMEAGTGSPYHQADGEQEPHSITTCKETLLEMMTSWNE